MFRLLAVATAAFLALPPTLDAGQPVNHTIPSSGSITIHADPLGFTCLLAPQDRIIEFYVVKNSAGAGFQGAEFRITGLPAGSLVLSKTGPPNSIEIGDPLGLGVNVALDACATDNREILYHYTVLLPDDEEHFLEIASHTNPSNPQFVCPHINLCDDPVFTKSCMVGGWAVVGVPPSQPDPAHAATGVALDADLSWTVGTIATCGLAHGASTSIYFGMEADPPFVASNGNPGGFPGPYDPGPLSPNTTYYWRVAHFSNGSISGPVWSFTTTSSVAVKESSWNSVKRLYH